MSRLRHAVYQVDAHAFEVAFGLMAVLVGLVQVIGGVSPLSLEALLPFWARTLWGAYLLTGGALVLAGIARRCNAFPGRGFGLERGGWFLLVLGYAVYAVALLSLNGASSYAVSLFMAMASIASWRRAVFLARRRVELLATVKAATEVTHA